jgi:hypothetical protein
MTFTPVHSTAAAPLVALLCASLAATPALAQTPVVALSDLVNQGSDYAQGQMRNRGYVFTHADTRGSKVWQYWWQSQDNVCARVAHVDGRASSIVSVSPTECNQYTQYSGYSTAPAATPQPQQASSDSSGLSTGAKVALAAAAAIGVAALAHRSHERDEQKYSDSQQVAEYERGYRDGLYHQPYHDYSRSQAYVDGYNAGQQRREAETSYRSPYAQHTGYAPYAAVNDLVGRPAGAYDGFMRQRGFVEKGGYTSGGQAFRTWWNAGTRQCVQAVIAYDRVQAMNTVYEGNCN